MDVILLLYLLYVGCGLAEPVCTFQHEPYLLLAAPLFDNSRRDLLIRLYNDQSNMQSDSRYMKYIYIYMHTYVHIYIHIYIYIYTYVSEYVSGYVYIYIHILMLYISEDDICIYIYMYIFYTHVLYILPHVYQLLVTF